MAIKFEDVEKIKTTLTSSAKRGFKFYMKNALLIILLAIGVSLFIEPQILMHPSVLIEHFSTGEGIRSVLIVLGIIIGIYVLLKSLIMDDVAANKSREEQNQKDIHAEKLEYRMKIYPAVNNAMKDLALEVECDNVSVFEFHNGTQNLMSIPFIYAERQYEFNSKDNDFLDDLTDFNLTRYPFFADHINDSVWCGTVKDIEKEDKRLGVRLKSNGYKYIAAYMLHNMGNPIGFMTIGYKEDINDEDRHKILASMSKSAQIVSQILSGK